MSMKDTLPTPGQFDVTTEGAASLWSDWKDRWMCYSDAMELDQKSKKVQVSTMLTIMGSEAHKVYKQLSWESEADKLDPFKVLEGFDRFVEPRRNNTYERYKFNSRNQKSDEGFEQYFTALKQQALSCAFDDITPDEILRDRLVFGICNNKVRERLLREHNLDLRRCVDLCRAAETSAAQMRDIGKLSDVNAVHRRTKLYSKPKFVS